MGAHSVLLVGDGGDLRFTYTGDTSGICIPDNVIRIDGTHDATIEVNLKGTTIETPAVYYGYRGTISTEEDLHRCINDLRLYANHTGEIDPDTPTKDLVGFDNCRNLKNCFCQSEGAIIGAMTVAFQNCIGITNSIGISINTKNSAIAFNKCSCCSGCSATGNSKTGNMVPGIGFQNCDYLTDCDAIASTAGGGTVHVFYKCNHMISCEAHLGSSTTYMYGFHLCIDLVDCHMDFQDGSNKGYPYGFQQCSRLLNCFVNMVSTDKSMTGGFNRCSWLVNCNSQLDVTGAMVATAFDTCDRLTSCYGLVSNSSKSSTFIRCKQLSNCQATGITTNGAYKGYGFEDCSYLSCCCQGESPSTTAFLGGTNTKVDSETVVAS